MPQLSLYLDDKTMIAMRKRAETQHVSLSKYVGQLIREQADSGWPTGYWDLYGCIEDASFLEPAELSFTLDGQRGQL